MRSGCRLQGTLWEGLLYARDANTVTKFVSAHAHKNTLALRGTMNLATFVM